jgi:hypothetical protein
MLLRQADRKICLSRAAAVVLHDDRDPERVTHSLRTLLFWRL